MNWKEQLEDARKADPQRVIIFDSPDGTGKTNIAQALSQMMNIPYFRMATQHENWRKGKFKQALEFDQTYLAEFLRQTRYDVIVDRAYPSEWVYSIAYGRETNAQVLYEVDRKFAAMGTIIVIPFRRDYSKNREDEVVANAMIPRLHQLYEDFMKWTACRTVTIYVDDYDNNSEKEIGALLPELNWPLKAIDYQWDTVLERKRTFKNIDADGRSDVGIEIGPDGEVQMKSVS